MPQRRLRRYYVPIHEVGYQDTDLIGQLDSWVEVLRIIPADFIRKTHEYSRDISKNISVEKNLVRIHSTGPDPYFSIRKKLPGKGIRCFLLLKLEVPHDTVLQIFFRTTRHNGFCEDDSIRRKVPGGLNTLCVIIAAEDFNGQIRIDPGEVSGSYIFHEILVKSERIGWAGWNLSPSGSFSQKLGTAIRTMLTKALPALKMINREAQPDKRIRIMFYTHNFNHEGAPHVLYSIARALKSRDRYNLMMLSPYDGPGRAELEKNGIRTLTFAVPKELPDNYLNDNTNGIRFADNMVTETLIANKPDILFVNVLHSFFVVNIADRLNIPCVWMIHESFDFRHYREQLNPYYGTRLDEAFRQACYAVFCSSISMKLYENCNVSGNFRMIHNALPPDFRKSQPDERQRQAIRAGFNLTDRDLLFINVGTIAEHKNQALIIRAAALLKNMNIKIFLIGASSNVPYLQNVEQMVVSCQVEEIVKIIPVTAEVIPYYLAADVFVFTSTNETYPLVILEAMAFRLPIITTPVIGVNEQVRFDFNALKTSYTDPADLAGCMIRLAENRQLREEMGRNSGIVYESLESFEEMIDSHEQLLLSALKERHATC